MEYCISVQFSSNSKSYYFKSEDESIKKGDLVVVESVFGIEVAKVSDDPKPLSQIKFPLKIKPILRKANKVDIQSKRENDRLAKQAAKVFVKSVADLNLDMNLIETTYTLDKSKVLFCYLSSDRVDFRELLKVLASKLNCRIELKQINPRDKAQLVGGIGVCGLELCCTKFLTVFEGISLTKAKNQMLSINIPKLSGQCGKLMCCLKYEDDYYTEQKKYYPAINSKLDYQSKEFKVVGINILSKTIKIENDDGFEIISLDEYKNIIFKRK